MSQIAVPIPAIDAQPYTITFMCTGRSRPQVSQLQFASKSGACNFHDTRPASSVPSNSQMIADA
jgi:hypothetical protein